MTRFSNNLTDIKCKSAKPQSKPYKLTDGKGLYLLIQVNGTKCWRYNYKLHGKWKTYSIGVYPQITLQEAREMHSQAYKMVSKGEDPNIAKRVNKISLRFDAENTFEQYGRKWLKKRKGEIKDKTLKEITRRLELNLFPEIGSLPITSITPPIMLGVLQKIEDRGSYYMTKRCRQYASQIFIFASLTELNLTDPTTVLTPRLRTKKIKHQKSMPLSELPVFLAKVERNEKRLYRQTILALKLMTITFTRKKELTHVSKNEVNLEDRIWLIDSDRMKMANDHIVPLSIQAVQIFQELIKINPDSEYFFTGVIDTTKPMNEDTPLRALYSLGYLGVHTVHGFRSLAMTTLLENLRYNKEIIDTQLAHTKKGSLGSAYDRAEYLEDRKKMMQDWADFIDKKLKEGLNKS